MDTTTAMALVTTNPTVSNMVAGDLATMWRRFAAAAIIVPSMEAATNLHMLIDPHLLPARCRLFRRMVAADVAAARMVAAAPVVAVVVASDIESSANRARLRNKGIASTLSIFCRM
jgi:hypothetical protein